ncbi:MAG: hypothetical protein F6K11_17290 [Leptolyngbya sp. SIO3F4]|nr:hypothetical protein [Leptolyngbya sp. SIO3F4]
MTVAILALLLAQFEIVIGVFCIKISVAEIGSLSTILTDAELSALYFFSGISCD